MGIAASVGSLGRSQLVRYVGVSLTSFKEMGIGPTFYWGALLMAAALVC